MKYLLSASVAALAIASAAQAGSLAPTPVEPQVAPVVVEPTETGTNWTGFYAGLQYGQGDLEASAGGASTTEDFSAYGAHAGYLYDMGSYVVGGELDYNSLEPDGAGDNADLIRLRGRVGADLGRFMPYVTLGVANLSDNSGSDISETGYTYGIGADYAITERFSVGLEYSRNEFDDVDGTVVDVDGDAIQIRGSFRF